jgi:hypothetical protein
MVMKLRIPSIENASFEDLWRMEQDEWISFDAFRRSIEQAIETAAASSVDERELTAAAQRIQRDLIEEPLAKLEERLKRLERIRRRKWASYALVPVTAALVTAIRPELAGPVSQALGALTILKIMEVYFSDLERDVGLSSEALYWLAMLRRDLKEA